MFIKLGIIAGIVILGGLIFSTEIDNIFPNTSATVFDSLMDDMSNFSSIASDSVEERIVEKIPPIIVNFIAPRAFPFNKKKCPGRIDRKDSLSGAPSKMLGIKSTNE